MHKVNRTDVANRNLRYSFHYNHQPMICFTISSSNKIILNFLYWGNIFYWNFVCFHIVKPLMPILALLPISFKYEKPRITSIYMVVVKGKYLYNYLNYLENKVQGVQCN